MPATKRPAAKNNGKSQQTFSAEERAAMREHVTETRRARAGLVDAESEVQRKIAEMQPADRAMAEKIHALIKSTVPSLAATTWYGMPAYAKDGKVVCFFQPGQKFKTRYATFGFSDKAKLDDGNMWPNSYALTKLTAPDEARIRALVKKAVG